MDGGELQRVWMLYVNAMRECQRAEARTRTLDDDCTMLARRNAKLIIEVDQLNDEISVLRRAIAPGHLQAQIAMLTYENEQLRQRSLNAALYEGEG
jgi:cell division protein FtsB